MFKGLLEVSVSISRTATRKLSNKDATFSKIHRQVYCRMYPVLLVNSDGSSYTIRHHEPRGIIRLPLDLDSLSEEEKQLRLEQRKPKQKIVIEDEVEDNFNAKKYVKFIKKGK